MVSGWKRKSPDQVVIDPGFLIYLAFSTVEILKGR